MRVLGFMSGTSLDGVDAAIIETDGESVSDFGPAVIEPYTDDERATLVRVTEAVVAAEGAKGSREFRRADEIVLAAHLRAAEAALRDGGSIELVGFHGQTVLHRPERRLSIQLGDPGALADALGVPVVAELRAADLRNGGQGAPIVPAYHAALADRAGLARPLAFLNLGGVANLTWLGNGAEPIAMDTGPANGLMDLLVQARGIGRYDDGGRLAAAGRVQVPALLTLLDHPHFGRTGPKSLDRYDFSLEPVAHLSVEDAAATLLAFTVEAVALAAEALPERPRLWIACGGGRHNPALMTRLAERLGSCVPADHLGFRGDFVEAEAMAFLAARSVRRLPITFPGTTGVPRPLTGGRAWQPRLGRAA